MSGGHPFIRLHPLLLSFPNETGFRLSRCVGLVGDEIRVGANVTMYDGDEVCGGPSTVLEMEQALLIIQPECVTL